MEGTENKMRRVRTIIMGAAGRDFHNFNVFFRDNDKYEVVAFTAAQIPGIERRNYPPELSGTLYPSGIPIIPEDELESEVKEKKIQLVVLAYSDLSHEDVMHKASRALAAGADFMLMGPRSTMLKSKLPVIAVCATRTGAGKSTVSRAIAATMKELGIKVAIIRHPMPYGNLKNEIVQRFSTYDDLDANQCTIEEREEYEPHIDMGNTVFAGVDYEKILRTAEREADVILWDGGNNDFPFYWSDLMIVVADPHRAGNELTYHPGETNVKMADVVVINKVDTATAEKVREVRDNIARLNPKALIIEAASDFYVSDESLIRGKKVLVVEDGPTVTHGEMREGVGAIAAKKFGASQIIDPRPFAKGSIKDVYERYPAVGPVLPAMGYSKEQMHDLEETINSIECDTVILGTPVDLGRIINLKRPTVRVRYEIHEKTGVKLKEIVERFLSGKVLTYSHQ
ncbi:MAG: cyclic 2,3-diphosphoglycerate synthase [Conexivisphaerales archaeon]